MLRYKVFPKLRSDKVFTNFKRFNSDDAEILGKFNTKKILLKIPHPQQVALKTTPVLKDEDTLLNLRNKSERLPIPQNFNYRTDFFQPQGKLESINVNDQIVSQNDPQLYQQPTSLSLSSYKPFHNYLPLNDKTHLLPYKNFPKNMLKPFQILKMKKFPKNNEKLRFSASSLAVGYWCELQTFYKIYSAEEEELPTKEMRLGTGIHKDLEMTAHPAKDLDESSYYQLVEKDIKERGIDQIKLDEIALYDSEQISRLISLFSFGEAREIKIYSLVDVNNNNQLMDKSSFKLENSETSPYLLITGIIDHLSLLPIVKDNFDLNFELNLYKDDLFEFLESAPNIINSFISQYYLKISDVKTRGYILIPRQKSIRDAHKFQLFYYRKLIGIMSGELTSKQKNFNEYYELKEKNDDPFCYELLVQNYSDRGIDIDSPISPDIVFLILLNFKFLHSDALKLCKGESINFEPFDSFVKTHYSNKTNSINYDLSSLTENEKFFENNLKTASDLEFMKKNLLTKWKYPFTLRFLIARLSQLFKLLYPFLSQSCSIEYISRSSSANKFEEEVTYNNDIFLEKLNDSLDFYYLKRNLKPVEPVDFHIYCDGRYPCKYKDVCSWYQERKK
ncbi:hypothetical protein PACTADRAFT_49730 [Pachysolen tannophilus NRRL Y-2460]|uniref:Exonuclease V, mitochondrial n=1 Tax=Pachysolen tannophilus NRRL Y-2460 TaxID=669874 RepID=A0A1E4TX90_PACTA|nr:hypothetical protein PACTADRAFT_49730 [Pachysolen tannophilus NRRL Y-2460]